MKSKEMLDLIEFSKLKKELFGDAMFIILEESNPKVIRYNELAIKVIPILQSFKKQINKEAK